MLKKKFFAKALAFAMVTGLMATSVPMTFAPVQVFAADEEVTTVSAEIHYESYSLTITPAEGDNYVFLEVLKKEDDTKPGTIYPYSCKDGTVTIDLSFLKVNKESYLRVWGDKNDTKVKLTVTAQPGKTKFKYANQTWPVQAEDEAAYKEKVVKYYMDSFGITGDAAKADYEIRSLYGMGWGDLIAKDSDGNVTSTTDMLSTLKVAGGTIMLRQKAVESKPADESAGTAAVVGVPAGPEAKVKITASAKAPKVTIDYAKGTIKLPKKAEYGVIDADGNLEYVSLPAGGSLAPRAILVEVAKKMGLEDTDSSKAASEFIQNAIDEGFNLVVRTNDEKKGASLPAFIAVKAAPTFEDDGDGKLIVKETVDGSEKVTELATYEFDDENGATVTVKSGAFEYKDGDKWKKVSSGKAIKGKTSLTLRIAGVKDKDDTKCSLPSDTEVEIKKNLTEVTLTAGEGTVVKGKTLQLTLAVKDKEGKPVSDPTVSYESSATATATVSNAGLVTGKAAGKCTITATVTLDGKEIKATVEVEVTAS